MFKQSYYNSRLAWFLGFSQFIFLYMFAKMIKLRVPILCLNTARSCYCSKPGLGYLYTLPCTGSNWSEIEMENFKYTLLTFTRCSVKKAKEIMFKQDT